MHHALEFDPDPLQPLDGLLGGEIPAATFFDQPAEARAAMMNYLAAAFGLLTLVGREEATKLLADIPARLRAGDFDGSFATTAIGGSVRRLTFQGQLRDADNGLRMPADAVDEATVYVLVIFDRSLRYAEVAGWMAGSEMRLRSKQRDD